MRTHSALLLLTAGALYLAPDRAAAQPANDLCTNTTIQALSVPGTVTVTGDNTGGLDNDGLGWEAVWEAFTLTSCADVTVDFCGSDPAYVEGDWFMLLYRDCPPLTEFWNNGQEQWTCPDQNLTMYFDGLDPGTYYYPVYAGGGNVGPYTINFKATACQDTVNQAPDAGDDVFTMDQDSTLEASVADNDSDVDNDSTELIWSVLDSGTAEVNGSLTFNADGTFTYAPDPGYAGEVSFTYTVCDTVPACDTALVTITITMPTPTPENDDCADMSADTLEIDDTLIFTGDNTGATIDGDYEPGSPMEADSLPSVWHVFATEECADVIVSYCGTAPAFQNVWTLLTTGCPGGANIVPADSVNGEDCGDGNTWIAFYDLPAGTYYLPVKLDTGSASPAVGPYSIQVSASACEVPPAPPVNDTCTGAVVLNVNLDCQPVFGTVQDATESLPAILCNEFEGWANDDVWYSFVATNPHQTSSVTGSEDFDPVVELFEGTCDNMVSLACSDTSVLGGTEAIELFDMVEGTNYLVRLYDYGEGYPLDPTFSICITGDVGTQVVAQETATFGLRPNPTEGQVTIDLGNFSGACTVDLLDVAGRIVQSERLTAVAGASFTLNFGSNVGAGLYTVRLSSTTMRAEKRLVVR